MSKYEATTTMRDYVRVLFRQRAVMIVTVLTVIVTVYVGLKLKTPVYEAGVKVLISAEKQVESPYYRELLAQRNVEVALTQSEIVRSKPVIERVVRVLNLSQEPLDYEKQFASPLKKIYVAWQARRMENKMAELNQQQKDLFLLQKAMDELKARIEVNPIRDTNMFTISIKDFSPVRSMQLANTVSRSYIIFDLEQQLAELTLKYGKKHPTVKQLQDSIEEMEKNLGGAVLPDVEAIGPASVKIIEQAIPPMRAAGTPEPLTFLLAVVMSFFLAVMLCFTFEYMDQTFKSPHELETVLGIPYLGDVPLIKSHRKARLLKHVSGLIPHRQAYYRISDQLMLMLKDKDIKSIVFASAAAKEGTSTLIAHLARCLSRKTEHNVLVIDANMRAPQQHSFFEIEEYPGLAEVLEGKKEFKAMLRDLEEGLHVMPAGRTELNPVTLLNSYRMREVLKNAHDAYDIVLIDSAHLLDYKDAEIISTVTDGVIFVVNEGTTRKEAAKKAFEPFMEKEANVLGAVMNSRTFNIPKYIYDRI